MQERFELTYKNQFVLPDLTFLLFSGKNFASSPELLKEDVTINVDKLNDVFSLLRNRFGEQWETNRRLSYFKQLLTSYKNIVKTVKQQKKKEIEESEESDCCSCCGEDEECLLL